MKSSHRQTDPLRAFTPDICLRFVRDWLRLEAWYARFLVRKCGISLDEVLENRVYLFGKTYRESDADWSAWKRTFAELMAVYANDDRSSVLESWTCMTDGRTAEANMAHYFATQFEKPIRESFAGFSYEFRPDYFAREEGTPDLLTLHFRNTFIPDSPFQHRDKLSEGLRTVVKRAGTERPDVTGMQCGTWLHSLAPFAALFPPWWREKTVPCGPGAHMGWWGQFMDRRGLFHEANGAYMRRTGQFPFQHRQLVGPLSELRAFLKQNSPS